MSPNQRRFCLLVCTLILCAAALYLLRSETTPSETVAAEIPPVTLKVSEPIPVAPSQELDVAIVTEPNTAATHDSEKLRALLTRNNASLKVKENPDGSKQVYIGSSHKTVAAAHRLEDGTLVTGCFESYPALEDFLNKRSPQAHNHKHSEIEVAER